MKIKYDPMVRELSGNFKDFPQFQKKHPQALPLSVNGRGVYAICDYCQLPIFNGRKFIVGEDCIQHPRCANEGAKLDAVSK